MSKGIGESTRKQMFECFSVWILNVHLLFCTKSLIPSSKFQSPRDSARCVQRKCANLFVCWALGCNNRIAAAYVFIQARLVNEAGARPPVQNFFVPDQTNQTEQQA
jgi:hypothetical protein